MMVENKLKGFGYALVALFSLLTVSSTYAVEVKHLYKASVVVADRSKQNLRHGSQEALAEVVIRVSGDSRALESYDITQAMANPNRFIEQYGYERFVRENAETGQPETAYRLKVTFNSRSVNRLIRRSGLPIWASNRAEVLIWLAVETESGRIIVNSDSAPELVEAVTKQAKRRGLPVAFPLNDLQEQVAVTPGDIWGMFMDRIVVNSERYSPGAILVGKIASRGADINLGSWNYYMDGNQDFFETQGASLAETLAPAIDQAADQLASKYAVAVGNGETDFVWLNVAGVENLADFAQLTAYLEKLVAVKQANMDRLQESDTRFRVYLESNLENLKQLLALDKKLIPVEHKAAAPGVKLVALEPEPLVPAISPEQSTELVGPVNPALPVEVAHKPTELHYHWHRTYVPAEP